MVKLFFLDLNFASLQVEEKGKELGRVQGVLTNDGRKEREWKGVRKEGIATKPEPYSDDVT